MKVKALLCDAATTRENLLNVLGGGITQLHREDYPASFTGAVAMIISPEYSELSRDHSLLIRIIDEDGVQVLETGMEFKMETSAGPDNVFGMPLVLNLNPLRVEHEGTYSIHVLIDNLELDTLTFTALPPGE